MVIVTFDENTPEDEINRFFNNIQVEATPNTMTMYQAYGEVVLFSNGGLDVFASVKSGRTL